MQTLWCHSDKWQGRMSTHISEFLDTHATDGALTPELAAQLLEGIDGKGDTGTTPDTDGEPTAVQAQDNAPQSEQGKTNADGVTTVELNDQNAVVLAKDGKHTIEYSKLVEAREDAKTWKAQAEAAQAQLTALQSKAQERAEAGAAATATDQQVAAATAAIESGAVDPEIFGDFSEEALAKGIQKLIALGVQQATEQLRGEVSSLVKPVQQAQELTARQKHYQAIYEKHADADSIAESKEMADWIGAQPSFMQSSLQAVLANGTAAQVIELFDTFKKATGTPAPASTDVRAKAMAAVAQVKQPVPLSLSDIPGVAGPANKTEAMEQMDAVSLLDAMQSMSQEQREAFLNRSL